MGKVVWTLKATANLEAIHDYIARDSAVYAQRFVRDLIKTTSRLDPFPLSGRVVPELAIPDIREVIFRNYRIVYRVKAGQNMVEVICVVHSSRDFMNTDII
jgi:addiction module RelE/StbE family toxin